MKMKGLSSSNDAIALLLDYVDIYSKIENILQNKSKDSTRKISSTTIGGR
jgi:dihydroneopterin aldolase